MRVAQERTHRMLAAQLGSQVGPLGWQMLKPEAPPEGAVQAFANDRCQVLVMAVPSPFDGPGDPMPMLHLAVAERGRPLIWEEAMQVIREVAGFEAEGIELFPAIRRELRGERSRHFYVLQQGEWPLGMVPPHEQRRREAERGMAQQVTDMLKGYKVLILVDDAQDPPHVRVFRDAADAAAAGLDGATLREALAAAVPPTEPNVEWSAAAEAHRAEAMAAAEGMKQRLIAEYTAAAAAERAQPVPIAPPTDEERAKAAEEEATAAAELAAMRENLIKN